METLRRLSGSPLVAQSQSAALGIRHGPHRSVSLRIQVSTALSIATQRLRILVAIFGQSCIRVLGVVCI